MRRWPLLLLACLISATSIVPVAQAKMTKAKVKAGAWKAGQQAKTTWGTLSPQQQDELRHRLDVAAQAAKAKWDALSPAQQQALIQKTETGAQVLKQKWDALPPGGSEE